VYKGHSILSFKSARMSFRWLYKGVLRETLLIVSYKTFIIENMAKNTKEIGDLGEGMAEKWLKSKGFSILDRNYWKKWGEIDIVAKNKGIIHFVEVKSTERRNIRNFEPENDSYRPEEKVHPWKLKRMSRVIQSYLMEIPRRGSGREDTEIEWQFDVLVVYLDSAEKLAKVKYLPNIVL